MSIESRNNQREIGLLRIGYWRDRVKSNLTDLPEDNKTPKALVNYLRERYAQRTQNFSKDFEDTLKEIESCGIDDIIETAASCLQKFFLKHYTLEELEIAMRDPRLNTEEGPDHFRINELMMAQLVREKGVVKIIKLHLAPLASRGTEVVSTLFLNGLQDLAEKLSVKESLQDVKSVEGYSWLIENYPKLVTQHGFSISVENSGHACINREVFLKRFGNK